MYAVPMIAAVSFWNSMGYSMLILLASMVMVPQEMLEAARVDGAGEFKCFFLIFIPQIKQALVNTLIFHYIWAFAVFEIPFVLGGIQGGVNYSMDYLSTLYYRTAFGGTNMVNNVGLGNTVAVLISVIILVGAALQMLLLSKSNE